MFLIKGLKLACNLHAELPHSGMVRDCKNNSNNKIITLVKKAILSVGNNQNKITFANDFILLNLKYYF